MYSCTRCYSYTDLASNRTVSHGGYLPSSYYGTGVGRGYVLQMANMAGSPDFGYALHYDGEIVFEAEIGSLTSLQLN